MIQITLNEIGYNVTTPAPGVRLLHFADRQSGIVVLVPMDAVSAAHLAHELAGSGIAVAGAGTAVAVAGANGNGGRG